jgi:hypothetical protein
MRGLAFQQEVLLGLTTNPRQRARIRHLEMVNAKTDNDPQIVEELLAVLGDIRAEAERHKKGPFPMHKINRFVKNHCLLPQKREEQTVLLAS